MHGILPRPGISIVEAEPEQALPALALGDLDLVLGDEWQHQPLRLPPLQQRHELLEDPVHLAVPDRLSAATLADLAGEPWTTGHAGMAWDQMTRRTCREHGGFEPDIHHRTNDATVSLALVAQGLAVALIPDLALPARHPGVTLLPTPVARRILAVTRTADAARPSIQALLAALPAS
jgi:DNA-binding transcriptional LysR family regulator